MGRTGVSGFSDLVRVQTQVNHKAQKQGQNLDSMATVPKEMPCLKRGRQKGNEIARGRWGEIDQYPDLRKFLVTWLRTILVTGIHCYYF